MLFQLPSTIHWLYESTALCQLNWNSGLSTRFIQLYNFWMQKNVFAAEIHYQQVEIYGEDVISWHSLTKWCIHFQTGTVMEDCKKKKKSGWHTTATTEYIRTHVGSAICSQVDYKVQTARRIKSVNIIQSIEFTKHMLILSASRTIWRPQDTVNGLSLFISATVFFQWSRISQAQCYRRQDMDSSPYLTVKMGQHGMETSWVPTNREIRIVKSSMVTVTLVMVTIFWDDKGVS